MFVCAVANNGWISIVKEHIDILLQERSLKTLKIPSGFSYLTLYDSPKRPIGKSESGPKAPSVGPI